MATQLAIEWVVDEEAAAYPLMPLRKRVPRGPRYGEATIWLRGCQRCNGSQVAEQDQDGGWARACMCCGARVWMGR